MVMVRLSIFVGLMMVACGAQAATVQPLMTFSESWDGKKLQYPEGEAEITAVHITVKPNETMKWHCHPMPVLAYVISGGTLRVETKDGDEHMFQPGDVINEVVNRWHRGTNLSDEPVKFVVFYAGAKGMKTTIYHKKGKEACEEKDEE